MKDILDMKENDTMEEEEQVWRLVFASSAMYVFKYVYTHEITSRGYVCNWLTRPKSMYVCREILASSAGLLVLDRSFGKENLRTEHLYSLLSIYSALIDCRICSGIEIISKPL